MMMKDEINEKIENILVFLTPTANDTEKDEPKTQIIKFRFFKLLSLLDLVHKVMVDDRHLLMR